MLRLASGATSLIGRGGEYKLSVDDDLYQKLNSELDRVYAEVRSLRVNQHVFWEVQEIIRVNRNLRKPSTFYGWMGNMYAAAMSSAVRRLVDRRRGTVSFVRLLEQVKARPSCVSREAYKRRCANSNLPLNYVDADYDGLVGRGMPHPDPAKIAIEISELKKQTERLKRFVDEHIAHQCCPNWRANFWPKWRMSLPVRG